MRPVIPGTLPPTNEFRPAGTAQACSSGRRQLKSLPMEIKPVSESRSALVHWMGIGDINGAGFVHGGVVMKLCDEVAGLAAIRHSQQRVVTGGVDRMTFLEPIEQGELVTFTASVNAVWRAAME